MHGDTSVDIKSEKGYTYFGKKIKKLIVNSKNRRKKQQPPRIDGDKIQISGLYY